MSVIIRDSKGFLIGHDKWYGFDNPWYSDNLHDALQFEDDSDANEYARSIELGEYSTVDFDSIMEAIDDLGD